MEGTQNRPYQIPAFVAAAALTCSREDDRVVVYQYDGKNF